MAGASGDGERTRTYRGSLAATVFLALLCALFGALFVFFGLLLVIGADAPAAVAIPFCAAALGLFLLTFCVVRGVTIVDDAGITIRWLRTRRLLWPDVIAVEVEHNAPVSAQRKRPVMGAVVYHRDGRRLMLPDVIDSRGLVAHREVQVIREVWERRRGEEWTPRPEVTAAARATVDAAERRESALVEAMGFSLTAVRVLVGCFLVVAVVFLATGNAGAFPDVPGGVLAGVFAAVAFAPVAIALAGMALRRRREGEGPDREGDGAPPR